MEEWIQLILFIIFGAVALFSRMLRRRDSQEEPDAPPEGEEITLPPWGNLPMEEELPVPEFVEEEITDDLPEPPPTQVASEPPPVEEEKQPQPSPAVPTIAGIPLSPQTFRQGIILAEILRTPKSLRETRQ